MHFLFPKLAVVGLALGFPLSSSFGIEFILIEERDVRVVVPNAVSADGSTIVGRANFPLDGDARGQRAFVWREGEGFTVINPVFEGNRTSANAVSADGSVVVGESNTSLGYSVGFRWIGGTSTPIMNPDSANTQPTVNPTGVSGDGSIVAGQTRPFPQNQILRSFTFIGGTFSNLGEVLEGTARSSGIHTNRVNAVSGNGRFLAGWSDAAENSGGVPLQGFRLDLETGAAQGLGFLPGGVNQSTAEAINDDGTVIAGLASSTVDGTTGSQFFRWTPETGMQGLGILLSGIAHAAISADGETIVGTSGERAFKWTAETGVVFLDTLVPELATWESTHGRGVSGDGRVIAGYGFPPGIPTSSGNEVGWVIRLPAADPDPDPDPEPDPDPPVTPDLLIAGDGGAVTITFSGDATLLAWDYRIERSVDLSAWELHALVSPAGAGVPPLVSTANGGVTVNTSVDGDTFTTTLTEAPPPAVFFRLIPALRGP
jgi:probable HAF family extracellular repeat protein